MRGPGIQPASMARRRDTSMYLWPPMSRTVVVPEARICRKVDTASSNRSSRSFLINSSTLSRPFQHTCTWASMRPGTRKPPPSTVSASRASDGRSDIGPAQAIRSSFTKRPARSMGSRPVPSMMVQSGIRIDIEQSPEFQVLPIHLQPSHLLCSSSRADCTLPMANLGGVM